MKKHFFLLLFAAFSIAAVAQKEESYGKYGIENEVGYSKMYGNNGIALGVQYSYSLATHWDLIAGLRSCVGWTKTPVEETPVNMAMLGTMGLNIGLRFKTNLSNRIMIGVSGAFFPQMELSPYMTPGCRYILGIIKFYAEGEIEAMYKLSESVSIGVYSNAIFSNAQDGIMPEVGLKTAFNIR